MIEAKQIHQFRLATSGELSGGSPIIEVEVFDGYEWKNRRTALPGGAPITSIPDGMTGLIQVVTATTYNLMIRAPYAGVINAVGGILEAGTCDIKVSIGGTPLGGGETSLSTTYAEVAHASDNVFAVNNIITMEISNLASSPANLDFVLKIIRVI